MIIMLPRPAYPHVLVPSALDNHTGDEGGFALEDGAAGKARTPTPPCACTRPVLLQAMFRDATSFNQALSWNTKSVTNMKVRAIA